jgi:hypothetical protein
MNAKVKSTTESLQKLLPGIVIRKTKPVVVTNPMNRKKVTVTAEYQAVYDYVRLCQKTNNTVGKQAAIDWVKQDDLAYEAFQTLVDCEMYRDITKTLRGNPALVSKILSGIR